MAEIQDFSVTDASNTGRWPEGMAPAAINNAGRADEGILARWYKDTDASIASSGSSNAYAVTSNRTIGALFDGLVIAWTANHTNTDAATLAVSGLTAKNIKRPNGDALVAGDIVNGQPVVVVYKSSPDEFRLLSTPSAVIGAAASQALMEAAASLITAVTPGRQHYHPGHPKAWGRAASDGTIVSGDYGVDSIAKSATGVYLVTLTTAMADSNYLVVPSLLVTTDRFCTWEIVSTTQFRIYTWAQSGATDVPFGFVVYGDV